MTSPDANGWMPIETAPRDATDVLIYVPDKGGWSDNPAIISAYYEVWWQDNAMVGCEIGGDPTHWQPLPLPPVTPEI